MANTKKTSNNVAKKNQTESLPTEFFEDEYTGFENVDQDSLQIPFLKIAQALTPQVQEDEPSHIEGLKPGHFFSPATGKSYGNEIRIVLLGYWRTYVKWGSDLGDFRGSITPDEFDALQNKKELRADGGMLIDDEEGIRYQDTRNFFVMLADHPEDGILIYPLSSTGITHAKKILTRASGIKYQGKTAPLFASVWKLSTVKNQNDQGTWFAIGDRRGLAAEHEGFVAKELQPYVKEAKDTAKTYLEQASQIDYSAAVTERQAEESDDNGF